MLHQHTTVTSGGSDGTGSSDRTSGSSGSTDSGSAGPTVPLAGRRQAARLIGVRGFRLGPPQRIGVELEYTVHHRDDPSRAITAAQLRTALGRHAPVTLGARVEPALLPAGGRVTVEPGGQVEISTAAQPSLGALWDAAECDRRYLVDLLARADLVPGTSGLDPYRRSSRILDTPRYAAMERAYAAGGSAGRTMMCSTAGLQICLDAGEPATVADRWAAVHLIGPPLVALFATADRFGGASTGLASARMQVWLDISAGRTDPVWTAASATASPQDAWAEYALTAPLLFQRRPGHDWSAPGDRTFDDWCATTPRPSSDDLDLHLSSLFPPVRPRGYLEVRYLDAQPGAEWIAPTALVAALLGDAATLRTVLELCRPVADRWRTSATDGLADPLLLAVAGELVAVALDRLPATGLPDALLTQVTEITRRRLAVGADA